MDQIEKVIKIIEDSYNSSDYFVGKIASKKYRIEHTFRVANIGKQIAINEGMNVEALVIACLLHDISYINDFDTEDDWLNHGRRAAQLSKDIVNSLDFDEETKNNILYGIAIHVDGKADFEGEENAFALSVGDADNIDRFDVYRFYELLKDSKYDELSYEEQVKFVSEKLERFNKYLEITFATPTATKLFHEKIQFALEYLLRLQSQLLNSKAIN